jgi:ABC-type sulfate transport system substrate-binding protein
MPYHQRGQVTFKKNRWQMKGGGFLQNYMRIFGQEGLGRPDVEFESEINSLRKYLSRKMDESEIPEVKALMVFTSEDVEIDGEGSPVLALKLKQLKDFVRQKAKEKKLSSETIDKLKTALE